MVEVIRLRYLSTKFCRADEKHKVMEANITNERNDQYSFSWWVMWGFPGLASFLYERDKNLANCGKDLPDYP